MKKQHAVLAAALIMMAPCVMAVGSGAPPSRVRPPKNTEQYRAEASRVRDMKLAEILGLSDEQLEKVREASVSRLEKQKKQDVKLKKEEARWEKAQKRRADAEEKISADYDSELRKILTPEQYAEYVKWRDSDYCVCPQAKESPSVDTIPECPEEENPGLGPIVKGPQPAILTKEAGK